MEDISKILIFCASVYVFYMWLGDYKSFRELGVPRKGAFPGASPVGVGLLILGALCGVVLAAFNTFSELALEVSDEQSTVYAPVLFYWLAAAFVEELIFRGYLFIDKGRFALLASIFGFSLIFALMHPYLWNYNIPEDASIFAGSLSFDFGVQALLATFGIFLCSCTFYALRFCPQNALRSLWPCIIAHFFYNLSVFCIKWQQGFVEWSL